MKSVTDKIQRKFYSLLTKEILNSEKCDRQKTKKILPMKDLIQTFN